MKKLVKPFCIGILGISILFNSCAKDGIDGIDGNNGVDGVDGTNGTDGADGMDETDFTSIDQLSFSKIGSFTNGNVQNDYIVYFS